VLERTDGPSASPSAFFRILAPDGWLPLVSRAQVKELYDDGVTQSWMVRLDAGME